MYAITMRNPFRRASSTGVTSWMLPIIMSLVFLHSNTAVAAERTVRTGVYHNRPKVFIGQDGRPSGFYIDILNEIASAENWKLEYVTCSWAQCLDMLGRGEIDVMVDVAWSEERDKRFDFNNETVLWNWSQLYTRKGYRLNDIFDLEGRKIVVVGGDIAYGELRSITKRFGVNCIFLEVESFEKALEYLEEKKAHAGLISRLFGLQREHEYNVERTFLLVSPFDLRFAVPQGRNPDILPAMDRHLIRMKKQKN